MRLPGSHRDRRCGDCDTDISHRGSRAVRCGDHQAAHEASQERARYEAKKDTVSSRRQLRRAGADDYEAQDVQPSSDGRVYPPQLITTPEQAANAIPRRVPQYRPNPRHDHNTRVRMDMAEQEPADQTSWGNLTALSSSGKFADFRAPAAPPPPNPYGLSVPRDRGSHSRAVRGEVT